MINNILDIKIKKRNTKLNNLVLYENINGKYLDLLLNSDLLISNEWNNKTQLQKYKSNYNNDNGLNKVIYKLSDINYGRVQAKNNIGLHMIKREFRNTLCNNKYIDGFVNIDILEKRNEISIILQTDSFINTLAETICLRILNLN